MTNQSHSLPVNDRVVMMSGGSTGIGAAIGRQLLDEGYRLSLGGRKPDAIEANFADAADRVLVTRFDATVPADAQGWLDRTLERFGGVDALVNNAGMSKPLSFKEGEESILDDMFDVNVKAPFRMIRLCLPHLARCGHGRIVNVASTDAKRFRDSSVSVAYAATKHALLAVSHAAKFAGWDDGIRVTAICPGAVDTDFVAMTPGATPKAQRIAPETIAEAVSFILRLPNNAAMSEMVINSRLESTL